MKVEVPDWLLAIARELGTLHRNKIDSTTDQLLTELAAYRVNWADLQAERDAALARAEAAEREAERWRHGAPIEGDFVCPNDLRACEAEAELAAAEAIGEWVRKAPSGSRWWRCADGTWQAHWAPLRCVFQGATLRELAEKLGLEGEG